MASVWHWLNDEGIRIYRTNKMKRLLLFLPFILVIGCSGDDETEPTITKEQYNKQTIIGKWVKFAQSPHRYYPVFYDATSKDTLIFGTDGKYTKIYQNSPQTPFSGEYSVSSLYLTLSGLFVYDLYFDDLDTMRLTEYGYGYDDSIMKYKRLK